MWESPSCRIEGTEPISTISLAECKSITGSEACATSSLIPSSAVFRLLRSHHRVPGLCGWNIIDHHAREDEIDRNKNRLSRAGVDRFVPGAPSLHGLRSGYRTREAIAIFFEP